MRWVQRKCCHEGRSCYGDDRCPFLRAQEARLKELEDLKPLVKWCTQYPSLAAEELHLLRNLYSEGRRR